MAVGISRSQFIKLERGERQLTERTIALAAKAFDVPVARVLGTDSLAPPSVPADRTVEAANARITPQATNQHRELSRLKGPHDVPVLGTGVCGDEGDFRFNGQTIDYAPRPPGIEGKKDVFVVYIVGDSMAEKYEDGDPVYVDPHRRPKPRDIVVVELKGQSEGEPGAAYVKRLVRRSGGKIVVEQFNPPRQLVFDESEVLQVHRVIPWTELIGM